MAAPLGHALAILVGLAARAWWRRDAAVWAGVAYASLPGVGVLGLFVSTDDLLLPAFAAALWALIRLRGGGPAVWTILLGVALGLGLLAKYAMLSLSLPWSFRRWPRETASCDACLAALSLGLLVAAPNLIWNFRAGFVTLGYRPECGMGGHGLELGRAGRVPCGSGRRVRRSLPATCPRWQACSGTWPIVLLSAGILAAVSMQALIRDANGNWAARLSPGRRPGACRVPRGGGAAAERNVQRPASGGDDLARACALAMPRFLTGSKSRPGSTSCSKKPRGARASSPSFRTIA